jgi:hypothetical protein
MASDKLNAAATIPRAVNPRTVNAMSSPIPSDTADAPDAASAIYFFTRCAASATI